MQYCPHCMRPATGPRCPHCGGDVNWTGQKGIDLPVGTVLAGGNGLRTYQIGAARGKGGFGITYIAVETNSGRRMAIKEYFPTRCAFRGGNGVTVQAMTGQEDSFRGGMNSFLEEGKMLLSQDDLPSVVHVIDYFQANGTAYLVMEYLDGVALHAQMTRMGGRIPVSELMPRLASLLRDIGQLHQRGVIHRDISPDNIMWMPDGGLKLLDFGSARSMESGKSMTVLMKQGFSPIEQYRSRGQGPYTDIYALAATIYYCVTGVIPPSSMERLGEDALQSPIALGAALTVQQETALLWALSIQPEARPQSMEAFAAMLYREGPMPNSQNFPPTGGFNSVPPQPQPQTQAGQTSWGQQRFATGQDTTYQTTTGQNTTYQTTTGQNTSYQYSYSYNGQISGQGQGGPNQPGGPTRGGGGSGGKNKLIPIIAAAAAVVVLIIIGISVLNGGGTVEPVQTSAPPSLSPATERPTPTVTPAPISVPGLTDDGFFYEIINQDHAVLIGCEENANFGYMPDDVDGIPITEIADGAFAGASVGGGANLPLYLETIGANAFQGCTDLTHVIAYSAVVTASTSFSGCDSLWFVSVYDTDASGWKLPSGVGLYYVGMTTEVGKLTDMERSGGLLFGETDSDITVLLDVKPGMGTVSGLDDVDWICAWALDNVGIGETVELGEYTLYPYEAFTKSSFTWSAPDGTLSDMWLLTCKTASGINAARPSGAPQIEPDLKLMQAALIRAAEYSEQGDASTRPDGSAWYTVLPEQDIGYNTVMCSYGNNYSDYTKMWNNIAEYMTEQYAPAISQSDNPEYAGQYYRQVGVAVAQQPDGQYCCWGFVLIPS